MPKEVKGTIPSYTGLLLFGLGFLMYANTLGHGHALDDAMVITDNAFTKKGLSGLSAIFSHDSFQGFFGEAGKSKLVAGGRYRPLSLATFALEMQVFGFSAFIGHLVNALLYGLCVFLIFRVLADILPLGPQQLWIAGITAALFAVHPLHTEVVANIKGRDEILAFLGGWLALWLAFRAVRLQRPMWHLLGACALFLGLLSKESAIVFIALIPLAIGYFEGKKPAWLGAIRHTIPYFFSAILFLALRGAVLGPGFGEGSLELMNNPFLKWQDGAYIPFRTDEKFATIVYTLGRYLKLLVIPYPLTHDYYPRHIPIIQLHEPLAFLSAGGYLVLITLAFRGLVRRGMLEFGVSLFLIALFPVSNILFPIGTNMAERLLFTPSLGYCLALASLLVHIPQPILRKCLLTSILVVYGGLTWARNPAWKDNFTLFTTDVIRSPQSAKVRNAAGGELLTQALKADSLTARRYRETAIGHLQEAIRIHPAYKNAWLLLGNAHYYLNDYDRAVTAYQGALALDDQYEDALKNMGLAYRDGGRIAGEIHGDLPKAMRWLGEAARILPGDYEAQRLAGVAWGFSGYHAQAITYFQAASRLKPELPDAWYNLGTAFYQSGDSENGARYHQKAADMDPSVQKRMSPGK